MRLPALRAVTRSGRAVLVAAAAGVLLAVAVVARRRPSAPPAGEATYVGSGACTACHADLARAWDGSAHHQAMLPATAPGASGGPPLRAPAADPLAVADGRLMMRGARLDYARDVPLTATLGRRHVEQYTGSLAPGRLQALPLAYDVVRGEWFDLFAGDARRPEDWGHWTNRGMNANAQCLFCHTTGYEKDYLLATDRYGSRWVEMGVGCEACHGPGAPHVRARREGAGVDPYRGSDPARLLDACASCHSRRVELGHWVPGADFLDAFEPEVLDSDAYYPDGQVREELYEVVSFQMSKMHARGVRCWDCHDVHGGGARAEGNALCLRCHDAGHAAPAHTRHPAESAGAACAGCHMPVTVYMQRDPRRDHAFTVPDPEATRALGVPNACGRCHADRDAAWAAERVQAWYPDGAARDRRRAVASTIAAARAGDPDSVPALRALLASDADAVRRASAARLLARFPTAPGVTAALLTALADPAPLVRAGAAQALAERPSRTPETQAGLVGALRDPVRAVRLHAALGLRDLKPEALGAAAGPDLATATAEWRASQELLGDTPEAHFNLALFHVARGEDGEAVAEYRAALRLWPTSIQAHHNLGMLFAEMGKPDQAEEEFQAVLAHDEVPETAFALGLLYGQQEGRWREAAAALERCLAADPAYPRARYDLGLAYARAGDPARALDTLEHAADEPATHAEAVRALVDIARETHDRARLERWVLEAVRLDPSLAESLRDQIGP